MTEFMPILCEKKCAGTKRTNHELVKKLSASEYLVKCKGCGDEHQIYFLVWENALSRPRRAGLTRYPYVEPHSGVLVKSAEHRSEVLKSMGFHAAPHGIDERYDNAPNEKARDISTDLHE